MENKLDRGNRSRSPTRRSLQAPKQEMVRGVRALVRGKQMDLTLRAGMNAAVSSALL